MSEVIWIDLPQTCYHGTVAQYLADANALDAPGRDVGLLLPENCFLTSAAIGFLAAWGLRHKHIGGRLSFSGGTWVCNYLSRMDLFRALEFPFEEKFQRHSEVGRFVPVALIGGPADCRLAVNALCDVVTHQFDNAREFMPALEWAVQEIVDNIVTHADAPVPGVLIAQHFPNKHQLSVGICDVGRGIKAALAESMDVLSNGDAITKALQKGVTRSKAIGMGFGLPGTLQITRLNGGRFDIWTGDANFCVHGDKERFFPMPEVPGTGVAFTLDTRRPVDMTQTFMGRPTMTFFEAECLRLADAGGLDVAAEVASTGNRLAAIPLRRKIHSLLPDMDRPLVLDFGQVTRASSSFLDELLGRLAVELTPEGLQRRVQVRGLSEHLRNMADTVIQERLALDGAKPEELM